jgi:hypothetical protein
VSRRRRLWRERERVCVECRAWSWCVCERGGTACALLLSRGARSRPFSRDVSNWRLIISMRYHKRCRRRTSGESPFARRHWSVSRPARSLSFSPSISPPPSPPPALAHSECEWCARASLSRPQQVVLLVCTGLRPGICLARWYAGFRLRRWQARRFGLCARVVHLSRVSLRRLWLCWRLWLGWRRHWRL